MKCFAPPTFSVGTWYEQPMQSLLASRIGMPADAKTSHVVILDGLQYTPCDLPFEAFLMTRLLKIHRPIVNSVPLTTILSARLSRCASAER